MKWMNGETTISKNNRKSHFHKWFAWYPVTVGTKIINDKERSIKVWLEFVMRKGEKWLGLYGGEWKYEYKLLIKEADKQDK